MSAIILKIGSADLSDITEQEGVDISTSPVYGAEFKATPYNAANKFSQIKLNA